MTEVPHVLGERAMLLAHRARLQALVVAKLAGLPDEPARRVGTPSGMTVHGIVAHLTDLERAWVRRWFAGRRGLHVGGADLSRVQEPGETPGRLPDLVAGYVAECARSDEVIEAHLLDELEVAGTRTLRWIVHHLNEETARHLGHLDLLCELVDGRTGDAGGPIGHD